VQPPPEVQVTDLTGGEEAKEEEEDFLNQIHQVASL
jgi:hypothetical protein